MPVTSLPSSLVATDPFTLLEQALWFAFDAHTDLRALVAVGNVVRFCNQDKANPAKDNLSTTDRPELALMPRTTLSNQNNSSSDGGITCRYTVVMTTGDLRTTGAKGTAGNKGVNQVRWAVLRALALYRDGVPDLPFSVSVRAVDGSERLEASEGNGSNVRAPDGWTAVVDIDVVMTFPWEELQG